MTYRLFSDLYITMMVLAKMKEILVRLILQSAPTLSHESLKLLVNSGFYNRNNDWSQV